MISFAINGDDRDFFYVYRTGDMLHLLFSKYGEPTGKVGSRAQYSLAMLQCINGTSNMEECLIDVFSPINYIGAPDGQMKKEIESINRALFYEDYKIEHDDRRAWIVSLAEETPDTSTISKSEYDELNERFKKMSAANEELTKDIEELNNQLSVANEVCAKYKSEVAKMKLPEKERLRQFIEWIATKKDEFLKAKGYQADQTKMVLDNFYNWIAQPINDFVGIQEQKDIATLPSIGYEKAYAVCCLLKDCKVVDIEKTTDEDLFQTFCSFNPRKQPKIVWLARKDELILFLRMIYGNLYNSQLEKAAQNCFVQETGDAYSGMKYKASDKDSTPCYKMFKQKMKKIQLFSDQD